MLYGEKPQPSMAPRRSFGMSADASTRSSHTCRDVSTFRSYGLITLIKTDWRHAVRVLLAVLADELIDSLLRPDLLRAAV